MSLTGANHMASFRDIILDHEEIEYIGTLGQLRFRTASYHCQSGDAHEEDSDDVSLQQRLPVVFAGDSSVNDLSRDGESSFFTSEAILICGGRRVSSSNGDRRGGMGL